MDALEREMRTLLREDAFPWLNMQEKTPRGVFSFQSIKEPKSKKENV